MSNHLFYESLGHIAVQHNGVPMTFVHVIPGHDTGVFRPQSFRPVGLAFEIDRGGVGIERQDGEDLATHLVDKGVGTEGLGPGDLNRIRVL